MVCNKCGRKIDFVSETNKTTGRAHTLIAIHKGDRATDLNANLLSSGYKGKLAAQLAKSCTLEPVEIVANPNRK